jgi:hypothetical protein
MFAEWHQQPKTILITQLLSAMNIIYRIEKFIETAKTYTRTYID